MEREQDLHFFPRTPRKLEFIFPFVREADAQLITGELRLSFPTKFISWRHHVAPQPKRSKRRTPPQLEKRD